MIPNLGKLIRKRRQEMSMTIEQLAEASDSSVSFISKLELEKLDNIKLKKLDEILKPLNLTLSDLFSFPTIKDSETITLIHYLAELPEDKRSELSGAILKLIQLNNN